MATKSKKDKIIAKPGKSTVAPKTMADLLKKYEVVHFGYKKGQRITGTVKSLTRNKLILDIGGKCEGMVAERAYNEARDFIKDLKVGDILDCNVLIPETPDGYVILSLREASQNAAWKKAEEALKSAAAVFVRGIQARSSGLIADFHGLTGFIPTSLLGADATKNPSNYINTTFKAVVVDLDRSERKVVLSEKAVSEAADIKLAKEALNSLKIGDIYEGVVNSVMDFGCFVQIPVKSNGKKVIAEGLVHVSEIAWEKTDNISAVIKINDKVKVRIIDIKDGKLALSMKQALKDPWSEVEKKYKKDKKVAGTVVRRTDFGVFIQLEPGVEGFIHLTQIPPGTKMDKGQALNLYVEDIDAKARKIGLGLILSAKPLGYK